jgi:hypothetical protein
MSDFKINKTEGDFDVNNTPRWTWQLKGYAPYKGAFQWGDEPEMIHIIQTGFRDRYLVVWEDAYEMVLGKTEILTREEIKNKFNIEFK